MEEVEAREALLDEKGKVGDVGDVAGLIDRKLVFVSV